MNSLEMHDKAKVTVHDTGDGENESSEQFQNFIYELFDRNGILNDLRAYLRGHIVQVLNSAQCGLCGLGETPVCQKRFTQRLDVTFQSINAIIAEYLLRKEFQYSLSVFVSEIPLANMMFDFCKSLYDYKNPTKNMKTLKFTEKDIFSIIHYLGIKCDSTNIEQLIKMYADPENPSLIMCIFKCMQLYQKPQNTSATETEVGDWDKKSIESSQNHGKVHSPKFLHNKCRHHTSCKYCQTRIERLKEKYSQKNKEMKLAFMELKASYDSEIELVRGEEQARAEGILKMQQEQLQQQIKELKNRYSAREAALERDADETRRFVRGLARRLRSRLSTVLEAATALRDERRRLDAKEESLKREMKLAEQILTSQGEELRSEICNELAALEGHLGAMKREREIINKERAQLETMKLKKENEKEDEIVKINYELMKEELAILKEHMRDFKLSSKTTVHKEISTEECDISNGISLQNNEHTYKKITSENGTGSKSNEKVVHSFLYDSCKVNDAPIKIVNDFRKEKNVNLTTDAGVQINVQATLDNSASSMCPVMSREFLIKLMERLHSEDNAQLKIMALQQGTQMEYLSAQQARLRLELETRQNMAPPIKRLPWEATIQPDMIQTKQPSAPRSPLPENTSDREHAPHTLETMNPSDAGNTSTSRKGKTKIQSTPRKTSSQDSVLQEEILKLRKLEIEAEAVEDAYLEFTRRQSERTASLHRNRGLRSPKLKKKLSPKVPAESTNNQPFKDTNKPLNYFEDTKNLFHLHHMAKHDYRPNLIEHKSKYVSKNHKIKTSNVIDPVVPVSEYIQAVENVHNKRLLETPLLEFRKYYYTNQSVNEPSSETSRTQNSSDIFPILQNSAVSPDTSVRPVKKHVRTQNKSPKNVKKVENKHNVQQLEYSLKKMYVNNINKEDSDAISLRNNKEVQKEMNLEEKFENVPRDRIEYQNTSGLQTLETESNIEEEIRQTDLTNIENDKPLSPSGSELPNSIVRSIQDSLKKIIVIEEGKSEDSKRRTEEIDLLTNRNSECTGSVKDSERMPHISPREKLPLSEKHGVEYESTTAINPNLILNAANVLFTNAEENNKENYTEEIEKTDEISNSLDSLTDVLKSNYGSDSHISLEKYSVDDNFWQTTS